MCSQEASRLLPHGHTSAVFFMVLFGFVEILNYLCTVKFFRKDFTMCEAI